MSLVLALLGIAVAAALGFAAGRRAAPADPMATPEPEAPPAAPAEPDLGSTPSSLAFERARLVRAYETEAERSRSAAATAAAVATHARALAEDRHALFDAIAKAREDAARYRSLVIAIEDQAAPPLLGSRGAPDDLKLIVGIGPVLERMLHQLGITTYRQIALWSERDIDAFDARLPEFPGRIRRDAWVVQARALHQSVYGEAPHR